MRPGKGNAAAILGTSPLALPVNLALAEDRTDEVLGASAPVPVVVAEAEGAIRRLGPRPRCRGQDPAFRVASTIFPVSAAADLAAQWP